MNMWYRMPFYIVIVTLLISCGGGDSTPSSSIVEGRVVSSSNVNLNTYKPLNSVSGLTNETQNIGIANALIEIFNDENSYTTHSDAEGYFVLDVAYGNYQMIVSKQDANNVKYWNKSIISINEESSQLNNVFISNHSGIDSIVITQNDIVTTNTNFSAGDTVTITINASDPNDLPLEYVFRRYRNNSLDITLQDWSATNTLTYTFLEEDAVNGFSIGVGVKNSDGVDADGFAGDAQGSATFNVTGLLSPAVIDGIVITQNDIVTTNTNFSAGDTVTITINASDPNDLPLEYIFRRYRNNSLDITLQDWSATNTLTYTFLEEDAVNGFSIGVGVKNNDGVDADGFAGDAQGSANFNINTL